MKAKIAGIMIISFILSLTLILCVSAAGTVAFGVSPMPGDINNDRKVTTDDARYALRFEAGIATPSAIQFAAADIDKDGEITLDDVRGIMLICTNVDISALTDTTSLSGNTSHVHSYGEWETMLAPTCKTEGKAVSRCTVCGNERTKILPKGAHNLVEGDCTHASYCTICGQKFTAAAGHKYTSWSTVVVPTCQAEGKAVCHCTVCGYEQTKVLPKTEHIAGSTDCTHATYCTVCGEKLSSAAGHKYTEWVTVVESTCKTEGKATCHCTVCGASKTKILPLSEHTLKAADCEHGSVCTVCGKEVGEPLGHDYKNGVCVRCGNGIQLDKSGDYVYANGTVIPFGASAAQLKNLLGNATDTFKLNQYNVQVYAGNYKSLIIVFLNNNKVTAVYTNSIDAIVNSGIERTTINSFTRKVTMSDVKVTFYVDNFSKSFDHNYALLAEHGQNDFAIKSTTDNSGHEKLSFHITNGCRAINGVATLKYNSTLAKTAYKHSTDMAKNNYFSHVDTTGKNPADRITADRIKWLVCGENIAAGYENAFLVTDAWYNSIDHRDNILDTDFTEVGVGFAYVENSSKLYYATQNYIKK